MYQRNYGDCGNYDHGAKPSIIDIDCAARKNPYYRSALWTGNHLQVTLMSISVGGDIGLELHPDVDQFIRIEKGCALVMMGQTKNNLDIQDTVDEHYAVIIPAGTWHNIINAGSIPLKVYTVYAPPHHPFGTVEATKEIAMAKEH